MMHISDTAIEFASKLRDVWDDREFVIGMLAIATHDDDKRAIIEFIDEGVDVNPETITVLALNLDDKRNGG